MKKEIEKTKEIIRESEKKYYEIFENANDVIVYVDKFGKILDVNRKVKDITGYEKEEMLKKNFFQLGLLKIREVPRLVRLFRVAVKKRDIQRDKGKLLQIIEFPITHKDGHDVFIEASTKAIKKDGKLTGFLSILRDVGDRKKVEETLQRDKDFLEIKVKERTKKLQEVQLEKMTHFHHLVEFGRLSSGICHDLINSLTAVYLNIEKVNDMQDVEVSEIKTYLDRAVVASGRMKNFMAAARKQITVQEYDTTFSLSEEIEQVIKIMEYKANHVNVKIDFYASKDIQTFGNPIKFNQVITNLINNAIDSYKIIFDSEECEIVKERKIEIRLSQKKDVIIIIVEDFARGISNEHINKIFNPFFTTKNLNEGTGIGLSLIKNIVEKNFHGTIEVESQEYQGAKFIVKFPKNKKQKKCIIYNISK